MTPMLSHSECAEAIRAVGDKRTVIVLGENGCSKSSIQHTLRQDPYFANHLVPPVMDCATLSDGSVLIPDIDRENKVSREYPNERWNLNAANNRDVKGSKPAVICLDEVFKVKNFMLNLLAPAILERRIGTQYFPEGTYIWGTSNLNEEGLGDAVQAHFRTRVLVVKMRKPTMNEWKNDFAIPNSLHPALIAYCGEYPRLFESFTDFLPGGSNAGKEQHKDNPHIYNPRTVQDGYVSPRTLHAASDVLYGCEERGASDATMLALLTGALGEGGAQDLKAYVKAGQSLVPFERIIADPEGSPIPTSAVAQIVMVNKFIVQTQTREQVAAVAKYAARMKAELQTMFVHHVANSPRLPLFASVAEFAPLLKDNRMFLNVK